MDLSNNSISLAGEFAVLSQLALRGFDANMTLGHTKSVDILVAHQQTGKMAKVEVKTHHRATTTHSKLFGHTISWVMGDKNENIIDSQLFYVFVTFLTNKDFRFFVVPSLVVANYVKEEHQYWRSSRNNQVEITSMRSFRIGLDLDGYPINTPLASEYEDKWELLLK